MSLFLKLTFLFCIGSLSGWVLEVFYRRFFSDANPERKWINPGLCQGPYLPLYGTGLCVLYLIAMSEKYYLLSNPIANKIMLFLVMSVSMTAIEYILGYLTLTYSHVRLWDYRNEWGNIQGLICPKFSMYWSILGAMYYFLIHPHILESLEWLANNLGFSFGVGLFFGIFSIDFANATNMVMTIKKYASEHDMVVKYEEFKEQIRAHHEARNLKYHFFAPLHTAKPVQEYLYDMKMQVEYKKEQFEAGVIQKKQEIEYELMETREEISNEVIQKVDKFKKKKG